MEKIYKCYGRRYSLKIVPYKSMPGLCSGCAFEGKYKFCTKAGSQLTAEEKMLNDRCLYDWRVNAVNSAIWEDVTPWYLRLWNRIIGRK